jgi:hypothetical protein
MAQGVGFLEKLTESRMCKRQIYAVLTGLKSMLDSYPGLRSLSLTATWAVKCQPFTLDSRIKIFTFLAQQKLIAITLKIPPDGGVGL